MYADVVVVVVAVDVVAVEVAAVVVVLIGVDVIVAGVVVLSVLKVLLLSSFAFTGIDRFGGPNIVEFSSSLDIVIVSFGENSSLLDSVLDVNSITLTTVIVAAKVYKKNIAKPIDLVMSNDL